MLVVISMSVQCRNHQVHLQVNCPVASGLGATVRPETKVFVETQRTQICFSDVVLSICAQKVLQIIFKSPLIVVN